MNCSQARSLFSPYLDGVVNGRQMRDLGNHLAQCAACNQEYAVLAATQRAVSSLGRRQAPPELSLKLRVALSHEVARARARSLAGLQVRLENALNAFMVPATAGVLSAIVFTVVFGRIAKLPSEGTAPYILLVYVGMLPWQFFANALSESSNSLITNSNMISKVYFPRLIIPIAPVLAGLVDFAIAFVLMLGMAMSSVSVAPHVMIFAVMPCRLVRV